MAVTFVWWVLMAIALHIYAGNGRAPEVFELVIPQGTSELIRDGKNPLEIPSTWSFRSGDTLALDNRDTVPQRLGVWIVDPGQRRDIKLSTFTGVLVCSLHPAGELDLEVAATRSDWILSVKASLLFGPALGVIAVVILRVSRSLDDGSDTNDDLPARRGSLPVPPEPVSRRADDVRVLPKRSTLVGTGAAVLVFAGVLVVAHPWSKEDGRTFNGFVESPPVQVGALSLPDAATGAPFSFRAQPGGLLLVFFGYATCPDVCPLTLANVEWVVSESAVATPGHTIDVAMATVDPGRDTAPGLVDYVQRRVRAAHALRTTDLDALERTANVFGAGFELGTPDTTGTYTVVHSAFVYGVDDQGYVRISWPYGIGRKAILDDVGRLVTG